MFFKESKTMKKIMLTLAAALIAVHQSSALQVAVKHLSRNSQTTLHQMLARKILIH